VLPGASGWPMMLRMSNDPRRYVYDFDAPPAGSADELRRLLGGKGSNLIVMARDLGLPVPPGFVVSTEACNAFLSGEWPAGLDDELRQHMNRLGERLGRRFGDADDPLLVSVRSGAPVSMPGMMDTILNLGLNDTTAKGLARQASDAEFAADCLARFREGYRAVIGGDLVPDDPWEQLRTAVEAVFHSWQSDRARAYRAREGIADDLGTAVTVQAMVFGNLGADSGTGVVFTRNPSTGEKELYGDVLFNAQGEDVVAGTHATEPIIELDERLPSVADELRGYVEVLEHHLADVCDIEFTIERGRLWMLQVRAGKRSPRAALRMAIDMAEDASFPLTREDAVRRVSSQLADPPRIFVTAGDSPAPIAVGLPASPGVATGAVATTSDAAEAAAARGESVILVRPETSPEDVRGMAKSAGVLTSRGGLASHAAVVARGWGIPAVVGATGVAIDGARVTIGDRSLAETDLISIDGSTGHVFVGELHGTWETAPEAAVLLAWAKELGIEIAAPTAEQANASAPKATTTNDPAANDEVSHDDVARILLIKGGATLDGLAEALSADAETAKRLVDGLVADKDAEKATDQIRLTPQGKLKAGDSFSAERAAAGLDDDRAGTILDEFHVLDARMKDIVTGWQVRDVGGEQVLNDHSDAAYDRALLDDLSALHTDVAAWLGPLATSARQFAVYRQRLGRALELSVSGDQRYVASPRVDSYHGTWFELHEHLIRLAGRRRADEAAAGRA
jgi:pyruvate,orthophosphate dikinase